MEHLYWVIEVFGPLDFDRLIDKRKQTANLNRNPKHNPDPKHNHNPIITLGLCEPQQNKLNPNDSSM